jgi:branched-subunit amino acid aminotransferase/4-amino-4-deoxychorismate lyase
MGNKVDYETNRLEFMVRSGLFKCTMYFSERERLHGCVFSFLVFGLGIWSSVLLVKNDRHLRRLSHGCKKLGFSHEAK